MTKTTFISLLCRLLHTAIARTNISVSVPCIMTLYRPFWMACDAWKSTLVSASSCMQRNAARSNTEDEIAFLPYADMIDFPTEVETLEKNVLEVHIYPICFYQHGWRFWTWLELMWSLTDFQQYHSSDEFKSLDCLLVDIQNHIYSKPILEHVHNTGMNTCWEYNGAPL